MADRAERKSAFFGGDMKALILSADKFEDSELLFPYYRLKEVGVEVVVASLRRGVIKGIHGYEVVADKTLDEVDPSDYAILVLPGGKAPALLRKEQKALEIARHFSAEQTHRRYLSRAADPDQCRPSGGTTRHLL